MHPKTPAGCAFSGMPEPKVMDRSGSIRLLHCFPVVSQRITNGSGCSHAVLSHTVLVWV